MKQVILLSVLNILLFTGCQVGGGVRVDNGYHHLQNIPPSHAPAHGLRHRYHYYPNAEFYFDVGRNMYFYLDSRGGWAFSAKLPSHLHGYLRSDYVEIEMEEDRPYLRHKAHKNKYKKHNYKKNRSGEHRYKDERKGRYEKDNKKNKQKDKYEKKKNRNKYDKSKSDENEDENERNKKGRRDERD